MFPSASFHSSHCRVRDDVLASPFGENFVSFFSVNLKDSSFMLVFLSDGLKSFLIEHYWLGFIGGTVFICTCMLLSCSNVARSCFPWNFILFLFLVSFVDHCTQETCKVFVYF